MRLQNGNNGTRGGRVEIYYGGSWEGICFDGWDIHDAFVACRQLGYSGADSITRETAGSFSRSLKKVQCKGNETTLGDCVHDGLSGGSCNYGYAGVICTGMLGFHHLTILLLSFRFKQSLAFGFHAYFWRQWRQRSQVVSRSDSRSSGPGFESRFEHYLDLFLGSPEFKFSATLVNNQLVCFGPVGILSNVMFSFVLVVCSAPLALVP